MVFSLPGTKVQWNEKASYRRLYVHISQKLLKIEAYKQCTEKKLYLSPIQMSHVFGPSVTAFYRVSQQEAQLVLG